MRDKVFLILLGGTIGLLLIAFLLDTKSEITPSSPAVVADQSVDAVASGTTPIVDSSDTAPATTTSSAPIALPAVPTPTKSVSPQPKPKPTAPLGGDIVLLDTESGTMVTIATARLVVPGFIALYRTNSNGRTELIGHSSLLSSGAYTNLPIQVDNPVAWKQVVTAVIHADDGDGVFEFPASDLYFKNGTALVYDEDVVDVPIVEERGLINGTVEAHLEEARQALLNSAD